MRVDQLERVGVAGQDDRVDPLRGGLARQRADHIVGLVALGGIDRDVEGTHQLLDAIELLVELVGRLAAAGLVLGVQIVAEGAADVEGHGDVARVVRFDRVEQDRDEAEDRVGRLAGRRAQPGIGQGVEGAEGQRVAVDQSEQRSVGH